MQYSPGAIPASPSCRVPHSPVAGFSRAEPILLENVSPKAVRQARRRSRATWPAAKAEDPPDVPEHGLAPNTPCTHSSVERCRRGRPAAPLALLGDVDFSATMATWPPLAAALSPIADASTPDSHSALRCSVAFSSDGPDGKDDIGPLIGHVQSLRDEVARASRGESPTSVLTTLQRPAIGDAPIMMADVDESPASV